MGGEPHQVLDTLPLVSQPVDRPLGAQRVRVGDLVSRQGVTVTGQCGQVVAVLPANPRG